MRKLILVVTTKDQFGERKMTNVWTADKPDSAAAIAKSAALHNLPDHMYRDTFDPQVWVFDVDNILPLDKS